MKKIYLASLSIALFTGLNAQVVTKAKKISRTSADMEIKPERTIKNTEKAFEIWGDSFGTPSNWVIGNAGNPAVNWQIGVVSNTGTYATGDIESTTAVDGYAMLDSDAIAGSTAEVSWIQNADINPIDLTGYPDVVVQFENNYRRWDSQIYMVVGFGNGTGASSVTWPNVVNGFDASTDVNVYEVFPTLNTNNDESANPELVQIVISDAIVAAAGQVDDVYIRFVWTGTYGYSWFIDDVSVVEQPDNDIQLVSSWVLGENNEGIEYGRMPLDQLDANLTIGSEVFNFGVLDQTAIEVDADFVSFSSLLTSSSILAANSELLENLASPALAVGLYEGTYTATSAGETMGAEFFNNTGLRNFEVTNNIYSTDGIGVHPAANLAVGSIGTDTFGADSADEFIVANRYHIKNNAMISGMRVMLATGTDVGAELIGVVMDTTTWFADDITPLLQTADIVAVTATDIANGYKDLWFSWVETLPANSYMFGVQLYSNANTANIMILDDQTVAQPSDASMIYVAGDLSVYTNGEAVAIRLLMGDQWGLGLNENTLTGVSIYPNPSEGIVNITNDNNTENSIEVYDLLGNSILSTSANTATTVDLSSNASGIYMIVVSNENGSIVERVSIK